MRDLGLRVAAFLAFALVVGGSTWAAYEHLAVRGGDLRTLDDAYAVGVGQTFSIPFAVLNTGAEEERATVALADAGTLAATAPERAVVLPPFGVGAGFLDVAVPANAEPGDYRIEVAAHAADGTRLASRAVDVEVLAEQGGLAPGGRALAYYVGRFDDGSVFDTNVREIAVGPWPKADVFQPHEQFSPFRLDAPPQSNVVPGLATAVLGMHANESRTVVVAPEGGYGEASREEQVPRVVEIARDHAVPHQDRSVPRAQFDQLVASTDQGDPASFRPGDRFTIRDERNTYPARIVTIDAQTVRYRFDLEVGAVYTLYPFWPEGSVVTSVEEAIVFRTTPTTAQGESFTYFEPWGNRTVVAAVNETTILLRHDVPVGFRYQAAPAANQPLAEYVVADVGEEEITVETQNPHPLAGRELVFDIRVVRLG